MKVDAGAAVAAQIEEVERSAAAAQEQLIAQHEAALAKVRADLTGDHEATVAALKQVCFPLSVVVLLVVVGSCFFWRRLLSEHF